MRIRRQILRWVDKGSQDGYTDQTVISTIGMKGEDKALGYTWDYRNYGARNPQAYNDPKLFEEYRRQDKPEYRNLTWLHSGTKDTKIRQEERKNEELALNVADWLMSFVNPNPRVKAPILAGVGNLKNIRSTVTGSDPLLAGAGNIRIPVNGNVAKGDRIPDTALASKEIKHKNRKDQLEKNKKSGEDFEMEIYQKKVKQGFKPQKQIIVKTKSGVKTRLDIISKEGGLDVSLYINPEFGWPQMKQIRLGLEKGLDVSVYAKPECDTKQMIEIRKNLENELNVNTSKKN